MGKKYCRDKRKAAEAFGDRNLDALNPLQIIIPNHLEESVILNENVLIAGQERKRIVFATQGTLHLLDIYRAEVAIDGTFKVTYGL